MILYLILRVCKYRIAGADAELRLLWYAYYIPKTFIPALFLMICIYIQRGTKKAKLDEIGSTLGKTSKEYQNQQKIIDSLEDKQVQYNNAVSKAKTERKGRRI